MMVVRTRDWLTIAISPSGQMSVTYSEVFFRVKTGSKENKVMQGIIEEQDRRNQILTEENEE